MGIEPNNERDIFVSALGMRSVEQRNAYLEATCANSPALLSRVQTLLAASEIEDSFLTTPALDPETFFDDSEVTEQPGTVIGRYKLLERIGEGGMGVVYLARQEQPIQREVALKIIRLGMDTKSVIARFEAERQALALMDHPNISRVFDAGETETGRPYFVMELVRGVPITDYCQAHKLGAKPRLELFVQVCQAVQHAHQKGIIHRDIKPTNILVSERDGAAVPKIIDFGVARATECRLSEMTALASSQAFVGTPAYMSPEQTNVAGNDVDTRTDIYSLGVVLYELLTGTTPFDGESLLRTGLDECRRIIREEPPARPSARAGSLALTDTDPGSRPTATHPAIPIDVLRNDLDWIVMKCLEKDRTRRYETANELVMDLRRYLRGEPVQARPPSAVYRAQKFVRRNKVVVGASIVLMLAAVVSTWQAVRATLAEREQSRLRRVGQEALQNEALQRQRAEAEQAAALQRAYNSDMNLVQQALAVNNRGRVVRLLERYRPAPGRPDLRQWEWRYFWNQSRSTATFSLPRQSSPIETVAISPDGHWLASRDRRGRLILWDLRTRTEVAVLAPEGFTSSAFVFSPNGDRLAAATMSGPRQSDVTIWTTATQQIGEHFSYPGSVAALAFHADGTRLMLASEDTTVRVWDLIRQQLHVVHSPAIEARRRWRRHVTLSASGVLLAVAESGRVRILNTETGLERTSAQVFEADIASLAFSPDERLLAVSPLFTGASTDIKLISTTSGETTQTLAGHSSWVPQVCFSHDGTQLVSAGADQTIRIWEVSDGQERAALPGHLSEVYCVAVAHNGRTIVGGGKDGALLGWELERVGSQKAFETLPVHVVDFQFLPGGDEMLTVSAEGTVDLWNTATLGKEERITAFGNKVHHLLVKPDGSRIVANTHDRGLQVLDWATREITPGPAVTADRRSPVELVGFIDDSRTLVTFGPGSTVSLWDATSWQPTATWQVEIENPWFRSAPILSPDGSLLFLGGSEGQLRFVNLGTGVVQTAGANEESWGISSMAFAPDGTILATASGEGTVTLWDAAQHKILDQLRGHLNGVHAVAFSPDGRRLASASLRDEAVKLWDMATRHEVATLQGEGFIRGHLQFSPDGALLVAVNAVSMIHIWRAPSLDQITRPETRPTPALAALPGSQANHSTENLDGPRGGAASVDRRTPR